MRCRTHRPDRADGGQRYVPSAVVARQAESDRFWPILLRCGLDDIQPDERRQQIGDPQHQQGDDKHHTDGKAQAIVAFNIQQAQLLRDIGVISYDTITSGRLAR